jgi:hypothetical protein
MAASCDTIYVADAGNNAIYKLAAGNLTLIAGLPQGPGAVEANGGLASNARFNAPTGIAVDANGDVYIADRDNSVVHKVNVTTGIITTVAGTFGVASSTGDGGLATSATLLSPHRLAVDAHGNIYIEENDDSGSGSTIRMVDAVTGKISTIAGPGVTGSGANGSIGYPADGTAATSAWIYNPYGVTLDAQGNVYIPNGDGNVVLKISNQAVLSGTPGAGDVGVHNISLSVSDGTNTGVQNFTISVPLDGACGSADGVASSFAPNANLCTSGTGSSVVTSSANKNYSWSCAGNYGGTTSQCSADWSVTGNGSGQGSGGVSGNGWVFAPEGSGANETGGFIPLTGNIKSPGSAPPAGYAFPFGLFDFVLHSGTVGTTATVSITFPGVLPLNAEYWKFGPTPEGYNCSGAGCAVAHWYKFPYAVFNGNQVTLTIRDGGVGDDDLIANSVIVDQGGPAIPPSTPVPTLSEWGMLLLSSMMALLGLARVRCRGGRTPV